MQGYLHVDSCIVVFFMVFTDKLVSYAAGTQGAVSIQVSCLAMLDCCLAMLDCMRI